MAFKTATVQTGKVVSTQSNFPVYVDLDRLGITTLAEAESVRVYADEAKTTEWAREIVSVTQMHVKVPSLTSSTEIFVDWDGVRSDYGVTTTYGAEAVWSDYLGVWHLDEASGNVKDSSGNSSDAVENGNPTYGESAKLDDGIELDGVGDSFTGIDSSILDVTAAFTLQSWMRSNGTGGGVIFSLGNTANRTQTLLFGDAGGTDRFIFFLRNNANQNIIQQPTSVGMGTLSMYHGVRDTTSPFLELYRNAVSLGTTTSNVTGTFTFNTATIGAWVGSSTTFELDGLIDELRIRQIALTQNWITTEYNNQNSEATFWGTWTDAGGGGGGGAAQTARRGVVMMM